MTRPTPRRSSLAGSSPITSPPAEPAAVDATGWTKDQHDEADQAEQMREMRAVEAEQAAPREQVVWPPQPLLFDFPRLNLDIPASHGLL